MQYGGINKWKKNVFSLVMAAYPRRFYFD
ncbi:hypothetical protein NC653_033516 [Populus alba x Populus x berolinensis]|uniref:Uncharacterized protein n=1 Tax=Populus alba x Populus x berolinensis TaxID=444605 RepID=A0AAD6LTV1_9ROSI|nr:hypothetical protein NC653_033516 [Populus alba x Populus x berolinensis]